ncbi:hypothetical protein BOX15_Mlig029254g1 [Macrostomum lignano]|uniref:Uncharacterized protein n=1 Tax=Macrostomum lignano TaxID=282301 RepID=A0A267EH56_9PLAT|nr:hypothetical protein BOX15_Mlig029254g1 [Macrostomum lignano]
MSNSEATDKRHLEQQIDQLLDRHRASLDRLSSAQLRSLARRFNTGDGQKRWTCMRWTGRLLLCLTAAAALMLTLSLELVAGGYATQSTAWLAASDLYVQKLFRRVSHSLRLYDTEAGRNLGGCLLANPFNRRPQPLCCGCGQLAVTRVRVDQANLTAVAQLIDSLYSRVVKPFQVAGTPAMPRWPSDEAEVDFAALASFVAENRPDFERGGNQLETLRCTRKGVPLIWASRLCDASRTCSRLGNRGLHGLSCRRPDRCCCGLFITCRPFEPSAGWCPGRATSASAQSEWAPSRCCWPAAPCHLAACSRLATSPRGASLPSPCRSAAA